MSKRTLYIIIGLLLFLDVAAFLIYIVGNSNRDGKSPINFALNDSSAVEQADTIPDVVLEDRFDTISRSVTYVSHEKIMVGNEGKRMFATVKLKLVWPVSINNRKDLGKLEKALMKKMVGSGVFGSIEECVDTLLLHPKFVMPSDNYVTTVVDSDTALGSNHTRFCCRVFPYLGTNFLLEMAVLIERFDGRMKHREMKVVHYDRLHHKVLGLDDIFNYSKREDILSLVNQSIEELKLRKKNKSIHEIYYIPHDFLLGSKSVIFYMGDGIIASAGSGMYEVPVRNSKLTPYFTDYYNELLNNDSHFKSYGFLTWSDEKEEPDKKEEPHKKGKKSKK